MEAGQGEQRTVDVFLMVDMLGLIFFYQAGLQLIVDASASDILFAQRVYNFLIGSYVISITFENMLKNTIVSDVWARATKKEFACIICLSIAMKPFLYFSGILGYIFMAGITLASRIMSGKYQIVFDNSITGKKDNTCQVCNGHK